jgi:anti-sigma factor RsiW
MKNHPFYKHFLEISWRRTLTPTEEEELLAWLEAHPEAKSAWEAENGLNDALEALTNPVVPSNFNARVLQAIERERSSEQRQTGRGIEWWRRFVPKTALAVAVAVAGFFSYQQYRSAQLQEKARQAEMVKSFVTVSKVPSLPDPEVLEDFDTIRLLSPLLADEKLLTLLQ